jgi:RNA polymerase sigma-70 factor (ECF subfamily)
MDAIPSLSDEEVLAAFAAGPSAETFADLVGRFRRSLHFVAWRVLGNANDVDDAVQTALLQAWRYRGTFRAHASALTWLWAVTRHAAIDLLRRRREKRRRCFTNAAPELLERAAPDYPGTTCPADLSTIRAAVAGLPPRYRQIVELLDLQELPYAAAADRLQVPIGTVRSRRHRALELLRDSLTPNP